MQCEVKICIVCIQYLLSEADVVIDAWMFLFRMGKNKDIDTTAFRHAIWHYVHCIYGVRHDDYNYGVINDLLEKNTRSFVKLIVCFPEKTTRKDYKRFMTEFMQSEKVINTSQFLYCCCWLCVLHCIKQPYFLVKLT